jgi:hypothetical protein
MSIDLRRRLLELVVAVAPLTTAGCDWVFDGGHDPVPPDAYESWDPPADCDQTYDQLIPEPPPEELEMLVRACEADENQCWQLCDAVVNDTYAYVATCQVTHDASGHHVHATTYCRFAEGRRPRGLARPRLARTNPTAHHFARAAYLEAASVHAFVRLARELASHGAPAALRDAATRSAADEVRHARAMAGLAAARGAVPPRVRVARPTRRSLEALAIENVTEGVVGETWGALVAFHQARHAPDPALRAVYARIADDETRHAELSHAVHAWACTKLRPAARRRVEAAQRRAVTTLRRASRKPLAPGLATELGLPSPAVTRDLFAGLHS